MSDDGLTIPLSVTEKRVVQQMARVEAQLVRSATKMENKFNRSNASVVSGFRRADAASSKFARGGLRQTSLQLNQVAQQGAVTGNYIQALAIQIPDLLLPFGTLAILLGTVAGAMTPFALSMISSAMAGGDLEAQLKSLEGAMSRLNDVQGRLTSGGLTEEYGAMTEQAIALLSVERQIAAIRAQSSLDDATRGIAGALGVGGSLDFDSGEIENLQGTIEALKTERDTIDAAASNLSDVALRGALDRVNEIDDQMSALIGVRKNLDDLADMLGITESEAQQVAARFAEIGQADGAQAQANTMIDLIGYISDVSDNLAEADEEGQQLLDQLVAASLAALDLAGVDVSSEISVAANEAERLAKNLALARRGQTMLNNIRNNPDFFDPRGESPGAGNVDYVPPNYNLPGVDMPPNPTTPKAKKIRKGSGGGSKGQSAQDKELNRLLRERDRILKDLETASQAYAKEHGDLNRLQKMGELTGAQYALALEKIDDKLMQAEFGEVINQIDSISAALANVAFEGASLGGALGGVFKKIVADLLASNLKRELTGLLIPSGGFGSGGGGGGFLSGILGLFSGRRAAGGAVSAGSLYGVNELGSEAFVPAVNGRVLSAQQAQEAIRPIASRGGGGAASVVVEGGNLTLSDDGSIKAHVQVSSRQARMGAVQDVKTGLPGFQQQINRDGKIV